MLQKEACAITIRTVSSDRIAALLQDWNGKRPEGRMAEAELRFRTECDRYLEVEINTQQELNRVDLLEKYLTGGHGFYVFLRCPAGLEGAVKAGKARLPVLLRHAEECYQSIAPSGSVRILIGLVQEKLDPNFELGVFIDVIERDRSERKRTEALRPSRPEPPQSNVVHYNFGQVS